MHIKSISEIESFHYRTLFHQFLFLTLGLMFLVGAILAKGAGMPVLKLWMKYPAVVMFLCSLAVACYRFIAQIRYRNLIRAEYFRDDDGDESQEELPKVIGWCKWNNKYREWEAVHGGDHGAYVALINEIRKRKYKFGGNYHQYGQFGCPVMDDKTVYLMTQRAWGDLMADVWGGDFTEFAWGDDMGKVPDKAATPLEKTEEDVKAEEKMKEEAKKRFEEEDAKRKEEKAKKDAANARAINAFLASLAKQYDGNVGGLVKHLKTELPGILDRVINGGAHSDDYKWVLNEKERAKVAKQDEKKRKEWLKHWNERFKFPFDGEDDDKSVENQPEANDNEQ